MTTSDNLSAAQPDCPVCSALQDKEYARQKYGWPENDTSLPAAANRLEEIKDLKPNASRKSVVKQCPLCGQFYHYETDYEYLTNGSEDEEFLTRIDEQQARKLLEGA